jgi:hypothetical protein
MPAPNSKNTKEPVIYKPLEPSSLFKRLGTFRQNGKSQNERSSKGKNNPTSPTSPTSPSSPSSPTSFKSPKSANNPTSLTGVNNPTEFHSARSQPPISYTNLLKNLVSIPNEFPTTEFPNDHPYASILKSVRGRIQGLLNNNESILKYINKDDIKKLENLLIYKSIQFLMDIVSNNDKITNDDIKQANIQYKPYTQKNTAEIPSNINKRPINYINDLYYVLRSLIKREKKELYAKQRKANMMANLNKRKSKGVNLKETLSNGTTSANKAKTATLNMLGSSTLEIRADFSTNIGEIIVRCTNGKCYLYKRVIS